MSAPGASTPQHPCPLLGRGYPWLLLAGSPWLAGWVQVKQDPETGALQFVPVRVQQADATRETVTFSPGALSALLAGNFSQGALEALAEAHEEL